RAEASADSPGEKVRALISGSIEVLCADQESVTLLLRLRGNSELELRALQRRRELTRRVIPLIDAAQASGEIRTHLHTGVLMRFLLGTVNAVIVGYEGGGRVSPVEIARHAVVLLLSGAAKD